MFENRFNSKKTDPLVEAVKNSLKDGEYRRQAEALVNEQFGVYSRRAVIREQLEAYDAAVEAAYTELKEGKKSHEKHESKAQEKKEHESYKGKRMKVLNKGEKKGSYWRYHKADDIDDYCRPEKGPSGGDREHLEELHKDTLKSYIKKAAHEKPYKSIAAVSYDADAGDRRASKMRRNREKGIDRAVEKLAKEETQVDEAAYSAKAARQGKDLGKPGKNFSKIAAKTGSKRVAGSILARIRAKHMKEENLEELSAFGREFAAARARGDTTFKWGNKSITTRQKGETASSWKSGADQRLGASLAGKAGVPAAKPATSGARMSSAASQGGTTPAPATAPSSTPTATPSVKRDTNGGETGINKSGSVSPGRTVSLDRPVDNHANSNAPSSPNDKADAAKNSTPGGVAGIEQKFKLKESVEVGGVRYKI